MTPAAPVGLPGRACAAASGDIAEPLAGTAPAADAWLIIEQHGAYGAKALLESGFPAQVGRALSTAQWSAVKVILARPTGRHSAADQPAQARVWLAHPGTAAMVSKVISDPSELLDLDPHACAAGQLPSWAPSLQPRLFVCTHAKRDVCCAVLGRAALAGLTDDAAWECSHLGGHRFAATGVLMPWGYVYGRLDSERVSAILPAARAGQVHLAGLRGRSCLSPAGQVADIHLRTALRLTEPGAVAVTGERRINDTVTVVSAGICAAAPVEVTIADSVTAGTSPPSCGAEPTTRTTRRVVAVTEARSATSD